MKEDNRKLHRLKLETKVGKMEFDNIIEYDWGFYYLFIRTIDRTLSVGRAIILEASRWYNDRWVEINIKKPKKNNTKKKTNGQAPKS